MTEIRSHSDSGQRDPLVVAEPKRAPWSDAADVLIVGFGGAGVVAALQAREQGASVIAVDRFGGGGATAFSGGVIYAGGTPQQRESGFDDTPEEMYRYLDAEGTPVRSETLRRFCEGSSQDLAWLESHGVPHGGNAFLDKTNYPPDGYWLYYTGNEKAPAFALKARPAPRGHRTVAPGFGGRLYFDRLRASALASGARFCAHSPAMRLVVDQESTVIGVEVNALPKSVWAGRQKLYDRVNPWLPLNGARAERAIASCQSLERQSGERLLLRALKGVILCTGGFTYNLEVLGRHRPLLAQNYQTLLRLGSMGDDGSGIALGQSVGGAVALMDNVFIARTIAPPNVFPVGLMVNASGQRFVSETAYSSILGKAITEQPAGGRAWLILGARDFWLGVRQSLFPGKGLFMLWGAPALLNITMGGTRRSRGLDGLARACGIDPTGLAQTVAQFNERVAAGEPDPLGKLPDHMRRLDDRAYYAVNVSLDNKFAPTPALTMGGLQVDEDSGSVVRADGSRVHGLYAAGRVAVGLCSAGYISGLSIADTVFAGRRAARAAARGT